MILEHRPDQCLVIDESDWFLRISFDQHRLPPRAVLSKMIDRQVADDAKQPRPDLRIVVEQPLVLETALSAVAPVDIAAGVGASVCPVGTTGDQGRAALLSVATAMTRQVVNDVAGIFE